MAAAAASGIWSGWAEEEPLAVLHYELPSGASCERRIGNVQGAPDEANEVIRDALTGLRLDTADILDGAAYSGAADNVLEDDEIYQNAYNWALFLRVQDALEAHGLDTKWASFEGQGICQ
ncbi:hypothetical protein [Microbacterium sp.]|uniref:hypothetical protein n=1 Tax=Microbacterium sp. TaxID=51671 RepID=UPI002811379C|nr:hypothetical protein [Microbacterium sp.]